jgi:hypothetical protein
MNIKLLHFSGPCSFATFVAAVGEEVLPAIRFVRCFQDGGVMCGVNMSTVDDRHWAVVCDAVQKAHTVEPVRVHHDLQMSNAAIALLTTHLM